MIAQNIIKPIDILLVENDPIDIRLFRRNLADAGEERFGLTCAGQLDETIRCLDEDEYDIVLLDLSLPDSQGFNTFVSVRMHAPQVPIILLTRDNNEELAVRALQNGAQDYLIKDQVDGNRLSKSIRYAIERHSAIRKEHRLAYFDVLTDLPNRQLFYDRLNQARSHAHRYKEKVALMYIDLDDFKHVNDLMGHDIGDLLLQSVAKRLGECLRQSDTVARIGGDEFTCILPNIEKSEDIKIVAQKILNALSCPFNIKGREIHISGSIGASLFPEDTDDSDELVRRADMAMYYAKNQGRNNFKFFHEGAGRNADGNAKGRVNNQKDLKECLRKYEKADAAKLGNAKLRMLEKIRKTVQNVQTV